MQTMRIALVGMHCAEWLIGNCYTNCASGMGCGRYDLLACVHSGCTECSDLCNRTVSAGAVARQLLWNHHTG